MKLFYGISQVCLEEPYYSQLNIFGQLWEKGTEVWHNFFNNTSQEDTTDEFDCDSESF